MSEDRIKKFGDFMSSSKVRRFMDHMVIKGSHKTWILGKSKDFELHIYYTPMKKSIIDMKIYPDMNIDELKLTFRVGDKIDLVRDWVEKNKYEITAEISRFN
jgi:hypothetical protein